jgi:NAD(P)-dependent dehydrogenase (short-subunit alcohol dehydrogenase family)
MANGIVVVTGASSGIGLETARELLRRGAEVVLACRDVQAGRAAAAGFPNASVEALDLADLGSIARFADRVLERHGAVDVLINNAGVAGGPRTTTADGFERHFGTNYLGHFALTTQLMPAARVVTVCSGVAARGRIDFDDLQRERRYRFVDAYAQSKLACLMFAVELDRRAKGLRSVAVDPGIVRTKLLRRPRSPAELAVATAQRLLGQTPARGALPSLPAATDGGIAGGEYIKLERGGPKRIDVPEAALDPEVRARLWTISAQLVGARPSCGSLVS